MYLNCRLEDNVFEGGGGSGAIWNFGMSIVRCSSVAGLEIWNSVQVGVFYSLEFTAHQCEAERVKQGEQTILVFFVSCIYVTQTNKI